MQLTSNPTYLPTILLKLSRHDASHFSFRFVLLKGKMYAKSVD